MKSKFYKFIVPFLLCLCHYFALIGVAPEMRVEILCEDNSVQPERPFYVAIKLHIPQGWHAYWKNPGDVGMPIEISWELPENYVVESVEWPSPKMFTTYGLTAFGYDEEIVILNKIKPAAKLVNQTDVLKLSLQWLLCSEEACQPGSSELNVPLNILNTIPKINPGLVDFFRDARAKLPIVSPDIRISQKDGIFQLEIPPLQIDLHNNLPQVQFFPEKNNLIDRNHTPIITLNEKEPPNYLVHLKVDKSYNLHDLGFKGVLILNSPKTVSGTTKSFFIDYLPENTTSDIAIANLKNNRNIVDDYAMEKTPLKQSNEAPQQSQSVMLALIFAFLGGILLNCMPCVLPVMSLKIMSFVKMAGQSRILIMRHGMLFTMGVVCSFWALASVMFILRAYGEVVGWGFQLQEPLFVAMLASLLFVLAMNLFGIFEWGVSLAAWAGQTELEASQASSGYMRSFLSGVLATAVATPCTGPFLGSAVGLAVTLPFFQSLSIFTSLALGMSSPYLLLAFFPSFLRFVPKPGSWMETFKQLMGFLLLATILWLLWVFGAQTNIFSLMCLLTGLLCFSIGCWIYGRVSMSVMSRMRLACAYATILVFGIVGVKVIIFPRETWNESDENVKGVHISNATNSHWEDFSVEKVEALRKAGKPVLVDFTAKWCLICQANHLVLSSNEVQKHLNQTGVTTFKADWTKNDPTITRALSKFGRNSVPLYVLYVADQEPIILPQILTPDVVISHLKILPTYEVALK